MENSVGACNLELIEFSRLDRLVEGQDNLGILHFGRNNLGREACLLVVEDEAVEAEADALCYLLLAKRMNVDGLT